jgi:hypothetical protein
MTEKGKNDLAKAEELDEMEKTLSSDSADLLERVLKTLRAGDRLKPKEKAKLEALYDKHFGEQDEEEKAEETDDDGIDEDDFV